MALVAKSSTMGSPPGPRMPTVNGLVRNRAWVPPYGATIGGADTALVKWIETIPPATAWSRRLDVSSKIRRLQPRVLRKLRRRTVQCDLAALEHVRLLRHLERHARVLLDEQDGRSLPVDVADDVEDLPHQQRRKPHRWLVEEEDPRPCQNTAGYGKHLLLASGKRARRSVQSPLQGREPPDLTLDGGAGLVT